MPNNFSKDILSKKSKAELLELAMEHNIPAYKKMNKSELVDSLLAQNQNKSQTEKEELIGQRAGRTGLWAKYSNHIYGLASLVGLVIAIYALNPGAEKRNGKAIVINDEIKEQRVAVVPFENRTGDSTLNILGVMSADWINQGLMDFEDIEVVSPYTIRANTKFLGTPQFAENTKAQNVITGNYYQSDDVLTFKLELTDAINGKVKIAFDDIKGSVSDKEAIVTQLREKITGYWQAKDLVDDRRIAAPKLEAYELYSQALNSNSTSVIKLAADADTTFHLATLNFLGMAGAGWGAEHPKYFARLENQFEKLTDYERSIFLGMKAIYHGDHNKAFQNYNALRIKYPYDYFVNFWCAFITSELMNNPELTIEIIEELPIRTQDQKEMGFYSNSSFLMYANALFSTNKLDKLSNYFKEYSANKDIDQGTYYAQKYITAIATNNNEARDILMQATESSIGSWILVWLMFNSEYPEIDRSIIKKTIVDHSDNSRLYPSSISTFENAENLSQKISYVDIDLSKHPIDNHTNFLYAIAEIAMDRDDLEATNLVVDKLLELSNSDRLISLPTVGPAHTLYTIGAIHAQLGNEDMAMDFITQAKEAGFYSSLRPYDKDVRLSSLYDLPEFKELIKPIWPEVKN